MKKMVLSVIFLGGLLPVFAAGEPDEIVIEMTGTPDKKTPEQNIWDKDAAQLTKLFRKKNKEYVLNKVDTADYKEQTLTAKDGTAYVMIQYGNDKWEYRKFLFKQKAPQKFVACADNAKGIVTVFQKYGVNMGMQKDDLLKAFSPLKFPGRQNTGTRLLTVYEIPQEQLPLKAKNSVYVVFEQSNLLELFGSADEFNAYQKSLTPPPPAEPKLPVKSAPKEQRKVVYKGLISGGTLHDRMYLPRIISGPFTPGPEPDFSNIK